MLNFALKICTYRLISSYRTFQDVHREYLADGIYHRSDVLSGLREAVKSGHLQNAVKLQELLNKHTIYMGGKSLLDTALLELLDEGNEFVGDFVELADQELGFNSFDEEVYIKTNKSWLIREINDKSGPE